MEESSLLDPPDDDQSDAGTAYIPSPSQSTIPPRQSAAAAAIPERFGRYRIVRCLGQGAMGTVYLADDTQLDRTVALKIPKFADAGDKELVERFYREARAAATLRHPNLCPVYDAGEIDGVNYLSMAFLEGSPLSQRLVEQGRPAVRDAVAIVLKLAKALDVAHKKGVIHRDLKPANIMIDVHGEPILMDFGLARRMNKEDSRLTQSGLVMGSPAYMSPEQVEADAAKMGPACDIYSLGVIFYELLTGEVPFKGSIAAVMGQIITATPKKPSDINGDIGPVLESICLKMLAKRPEDRFASMHDVAAALEGYTAGRGAVIEEVPRRSRTQTSRPASSDGAEGRPSRGIVVAPWMFWTAVAIGIVGFGVTWQLFALMMKQQTVAEEIKVGRMTKEAIASGEAKVSVNGKELSRDQLKQPIELKTGDNTLKVERGGDTTPYPISVAAADEPSYLVETKEGWQPKWNHRIVAEWVLSHDGTLKLGGFDSRLTNVETIPKDKFEITEIALLPGAKIPEFELNAISMLRSLKRLVLPQTALSERQVKRLRDALPPGCAIDL